MKLFTDYRTQALVCFDCVSDEQVATVRQFLLFSSFLTFIFCQVTRLFFVFLHHLKLLCDRGTIELFFIYLLVSLLLSFTQHNQTGVSLDELILRSAQIARPAAVLRHHCCKILVSAKFLKKRATINCKRNVCIKSHETVNVKS